MGVSATVHSAAPVLQATEGDFANCTNVTQLAKMVANALARDAVNVRQDMSVLSVKKVFASHLV